VNASGLEPAQELQLLVRQMTWEAHGVLSLQLADPYGDDLPSWEPGAHLDLWLPAGVRQYSLCGDPADRKHYRIGVLEEAASRGCSRFVHETLRPGDHVVVGAPRNRFPLVPAGEYLFIAGGIGITPLLPMVRAAQARGKAWSLVYGGRSRESMGFLEDVEAIGGAVEVRPQDEFGLLDLERILGTPRAGVQVYCCGPEALLLAVEQRCVSWPEGSLHVERFAPKAPAEDLESTSFEAVCARTGTTVHVPADLSLLEALDGAGIPVANACREGLCGSCELTVLDGVPQHRDSLLTSAERESGKTLLSCVSRACGPRLVLDV
jgi:ferredoxin-NADP reductase